MRLPKLSKRGLALGACGVLLALPLIPVAASADAATDRTDDVGVVAADNAATKAGRECVNSKDKGDAGAKACFVDDGDEWYSCDIDEGSGHAHVRAWEYNRKGKDGVIVGEDITKQEDNATDGTAVLGDCDEGEEVNINEGNWIKIRACIEKGQDLKQKSCRVKWIAE